MIADTFQEPFRRPPRRDISCRMHCQTNINKIGRTGLHDLIDPMILRIQHEPKKNAQTILPVPVEVGERARSMTKSNLRLVLIEDVGGFIPKSSRPASLAAQSCR